MDFQAKCIQFLGETTGTSKAGNPWKKKEWVVETYGQYPKKVKIQSFGDRSDSLNIEPGRDYTFSVDLESREYNGRWYTDVSVFRVEEAGAPQQMGQPGGYPGGYPGGGYPSAPQTSMGQPYGANPGQQQFGGGQNFAPQGGDEDLPF